jgi:hypothetical protein
MKIKTEEALDLGTWMGRRQSLATVAGVCSAADAKCLRTMREQKKYRKLGITWEQFCKERLGISRSWADQIIRLDEELGPMYFTFAQVTGTTPEQFRKLRPAISGQALLHAGESIPIDAEHAPRLAIAVEELTRKEPKPTPAVDADRAVDRVERWLDSAVQQLDHLREAKLSPDNRQRLKTAVLAGSLRLKLSEADIP